MSQPEFGDHMDTCLPSEESRESTCAKKEGSKRKGFPWAFWIWQLFPLAFFIFLYPPRGISTWWLHKSLIGWFMEHPSGQLFAMLHFAAWINQGVLLSYWMVWGSGHWIIRFCKVLGLILVAILLPLIWSARLSDPDIASLPWSDILDPFFLFRGFLLATSLSFIPALLVVGLLYILGFRIRPNEYPALPLSEWQISLKGLCIITLFCSLLLSFIFVVYPKISTICKPTDWSVGILESATAVFLGVALTALLSAVILFSQNWRTFSIVFALLLVAFVGGAIGKPKTQLDSNYFTLTAVLHMASTVAFGNMVSLAINRYWIGWYRFKLIRLSKQASPQEA
ncbi:MAG: hypothetical protein ACO1RA_01030 [Planctomycetaceae bacterium]